MGDLVIATARPHSLHSLHHLIDPLQNPPNARIKLVGLDITDSFESIQFAIQSAISDSGSPGWGRIDILVNNAGFGPAATLEEGGVEALKYCYETNVFGHVKVTNAVVPIMRKSGNGGQVVFIGSRSAWKTGPPVSFIHPRLSFYSHIAICSRLSQETFLYSSYQDSTLPLKQLYMHS
jgi:NAD(P)-dependent dehydrogenase (short-subunit alcohol dehydrogenase family)